MPQGRAPRVASRRVNPDAAGRIAWQFVAMINLRYYPANHEREFPEVVRVEHVASCFDAAEPFLPVVASVEVVDETMLNEG